MKLLLLLACFAILTALAQPSQEPKTRTDLEQEREILAQAYKSAPGNKANRRAYARVLFELGDIWEANDVISPLVIPTSSHPEDLKLGGKTALLTSDYKRAESLFSRLKEIAKPETEDYLDAVKGLAMVYYQTNQYNKAKTLQLPEGEGKASMYSLLTFMQRFEGMPYQIEWGNPEKVAHLPIINDFSPPGSLPLLVLEINGHTVRFILDTGGDRLYIDENVAKAIGIRNIAERKAKYAYTKGEYVDEPLGIAEAVKMGDLTIKNVPVIVAKWKALVGEDHSDGVLTTQILKQFLSTVDYGNKRITFRERSEAGQKQLEATFGEQTPRTMFFFMASTHLMYTKGSLNERTGLNMFMDSGLAASMPLVILNETAEWLGLEKNPIEGTPYYWSPIESYGIGNMTRGATQALGNVLVEENAYRSLGFLFDVLVSHQYLRHWGSWTIDFDNMAYYFPANVSATETQSESTAPASSEKVEIGPLEAYVGSYEIAPGVALEITIADDVLFLQAPGQQKVPLQAEEDGTFSIPMAEAKVVFEKDEQGVFQQLTLFQGGNETKAKRK